MLEKDIKVLWGRAASRCSNCRIELTLTGSATTIGEMAHIVARSVDGPRGDNDLPLSERNNYDNLILLCPNHHREIDKNPESWSVDRVSRLKSQHEAWVTDQLDAGRLAVLSFVSAEPIEERTRNWKNRYGNRSVFGISLSPLQLEGEILNPMANDFAIKLANVKLQGENGEELTQRYLVKPNPDGIGCVSNDNATVGYRHHLQVDRTGYLEIVCEIQGEADRSRNHFNEWHKNVKISGPLFDYKLLADIVESALRWFETVISYPLPYKDKKLTWCLTCTSNSNMLASIDRGRLTLGTPVNTMLLTDSFIISDDESPFESRHAILERVCNSYGLVLTESDVERYAENEPHKFRL